MRCRAIAAGLIAAAAAAAAAGTAAPAKAEPPPGGETGPDRTPPVIHIDIPGGAVDGWYREPVEVRVTATDSWGIADLEFTLTGAHTDSGAAPGSTGFRRVIENQGVSTLNIVATDGVGNQAVREYGIGIDLSDPTVAFAGPATDGRVIRQGDSATLTFSCADVPTHVTDCYGRVGDEPFHSGEAVPTANRGPQAVTVTAVDAVGRWVERQFTYTVAEPQLKINGRPSISGNPGTVRVGDTLAATGGTFTPAATHLEYRWKVGDRAPVSGQTYVVTPDDLGKRIQLSVVGSRAEHAPTTAEATNDVPVVTGTYLVTGNPTVTGTAREGGLLRIAEPAITPAPRGRDNLWTIAGAEVETDSPVLPLTSAHVGKRVSCVQRYTGPGFADLTVPCRFAGGASSVVVTGNAWTVRAPARLAGKAKVGKKLRAVAPALSGRADRYAYQWLRNGKVIKGATAAAYRPRAKDVKTRISVRVTATTAHRPATVSVSPAQRVRR
ncbi:hypothetical protein [Pimelobacter sp. 30-1]|uniref:hypothetical protein n=1 Tax=Pimelobacter sp. 30-1 TaxID=2004991 RepID=UPI001C04A7E5|nr:hypothetical protein [Pimelobacter sp. 30-1]MBU2694915.1 hypothetical protein [Pimelobacter sp. 30-1]